MSVAATGWLFRLNSLCPNHTLFIWRRENLLLLKIIFLTQQTFNSFDRFLIHYILYRFQFRMVSQEELVQAEILTGNTYCMKEQTNK